MTQSPSHKLTESVFACSDAFARLETAEREVLLSLLADRPQTIAKGQDLKKATQGAPIGWLLLDGWAARYKLLPDGRRQILTFFLPGDIVDPLRAIAPRQDFAVMAITDVVVAAFRSDRLLETTAAVPGLRTLMAQLITREQELLAEHLLSVGRRTAREAVAHLILELVSRLRAGEASGATLTMPITQSEIGDALGLSTVHVNRTLRDLESDGLIERRRTRLALADVEALRRVAGFDTGYLRDGYLHDGCRHDGGPHHDGRRGGGLQDGHVAPPAACGCLQSEA